MKIKYPSLGESLELQIAVCDFVKKNVDEEGNIKITTEDIIKQKEKEFGKKLEFVN